MCSTRSLHSVETPVLPRSIILSHRSPSAGRPLVDSTGQCLARGRRYVVVAQRWNPLTDCPAWCISTSSDRTQGGWPAQASAQALTRYNRSRRAAWSDAILLQEHRCTVFAWRRLPLPEAFARRAQVARRRRWRRRRRRWQQGVEILRAGVMRQCLARGCRYVVVA